jgi:predicted RNase H-like HicB family nuclease
MTMPTENAGLNGRFQNAGWSVRGLYATRVSSARATAPNARPASMPPRNRARSTSRQLRPKSQHERESTARAERAAVEAKLPSGLVNLGFGSSARATRSPRSPAKPLGEAQSVSFTPPSGAGSVWGDDHEVCRQGSAEGSVRTTRKWLFLCTVAGLRGVIATGRALEACRDRLAEVIEEWILVRVARGLPVPAIGGARVEVKRAS